MTKTFNRLLALLTCLCAGFMIAVADPAYAACLSDGESRQVVASGQAVPLSTALRRAGVQGEVVRVALCQQGGGYVYQLSILQSGGRLQSLTIPAR